MSNLGSESEFLDLEKGKGASDPETASASASVERAAAAAELEDTELVTDPREARLVNLAVVVFCVAAIVVFVYSVYSMYNGTVSFWEAFGYCAVYFVICLLSIGTVLVVRKALISIYAAARPAAAAAAATTAAGPDATTSTACPDATTTDPMKFLFLLP